MNNNWTGLDKYYTDPSLKDIYNTLLNEDLSDCVVLARNVLSKTNNWLIFQFCEKSTSVSRSFLERGLINFRGYYDAEQALLAFNNALTFAPINSDVMQLAYCCRAELCLCFPNTFSLSLNNINTCLALDCPRRIVHKLTEMKSTASELLYIEREALEYTSPFVDNFFKLKSINVDAPCATPDVDVIVESGQVKVVATKDIRVGTLLVNETAFMAATHSKNVTTSCHYCLRMSPDSIPCEGCCKAMFCDENCKEKSMLEGHDVECKIVDIIVDDIKLPFQTVLKIRRLCSSWDEFIAVSKDLGADGEKNEITAKIFGSNKFSVLKPRADNPFVHGRMFNRCMCIVNIIHYLETRTSFFPECSEEREAAIRAVARIFLYLCLYCTPVRMLHVTHCAKVELHDFTNRGYFPLIGNLDHSCTPNTYVIGLRNSAALFALKPIKKGELLTFSYIGHYLETEEYGKERATKLLHDYGIACKDCVICENNVPLTQNLNPEQLEAFRSMPRGQIEENTKNIYKEICRVMYLLNSVSFSKEYDEAYIEFIRCVMFFVRINYRNDYLKTYEENRLLIPLTTSI